MSIVNDCADFGKLAGLSGAEVSALARFVESNGLQDKLSEHLTYARKRPGSATQLGQEWKSKLARAGVSAAPTATAPPSMPASAPPPLQIETYSHAAIAGKQIAGEWTLESAAERGATHVWRAGLESWLPIADRMIRPSVQVKPTIPTIDGFNIPWPKSVELAKNGKLYVNLSGSLKAMGRGLIGIEISMLRGLLGENPEYREAILKEVDRLAS